MMQLSIPKDRLLDLVVTQIRNNFLIESCEEMAVHRFLDPALERLEVCFTPNQNKYYRRDGFLYFNPYHSSQYCTFLYFLGNTIYRNNLGGLLSDKLYYLNKQLNCLDLYYEIELPPVFFTDHPVGTVMGRAKYGTHFSFTQNCTVGNNKGVYPVIGKHVTMFSGSTILGKSRVGDYAQIGAGAIVKDQDVPSGAIAFGVSPNLIFKKRRDL